MNTNKMLSRARKILNSLYVLQMITFIIEKVWLISPLNSYIQNLCIPFLILFISYHSGLDEANANINNPGINERGNGRNNSTENSNILDNERGHNGEDNLSGQPNNTSKKELNKSYKRTLKIKNSC